MLQVKWKAARGDPNAMFSSSRTPEHMQALQVGLQELQIQRQTEHFSEMERELSAIRINTSYYR